MHNHGKTEHVRDYEVDAEDEDEDEDEDVPTAKNVKFNKALNNQQKYIGRSAKSQLTEIDRRTGSAIRQEQKRIDKQTGDDYGNKRHTSKATDKKGKKVTDPSPDGSDDEGEDVEDFNGSDDFVDEEDEIDDSDDDDYDNESLRGNKYGRKSKGISTRKPIRRAMSDGEFEHTSGPAGSDLDEVTHNKTDSSRPRRRAMPPRNSRRR